MSLFSRIFGPKKDSSKHQGIVEDPCDICGHDFNTHLVKGYGEPPTEGWMECPVDGCECERTWSLDEESKKGIEEKNNAVSS